MRAKEPIVERRVDCCDPRRFMPLKILVVAFEVGRGVVSGVVSRGIVAEVAAIGT